MTNLNEYEAKCFANATAFTAVRGFGAKRTRDEFATYDLAVAFAAEFADGRTMIYAVTKDGMSAHITNI